MNETIDWRVPGGHSSDGASVLATGGAKEVWCLTSELEGERASSFRQERWCNIFLDMGASVRILNIQGAARLTHIHCQDHAQFKQFRREVLARVRPAASVREGWLAWALRRIKHLLLIDLYLPNVFKLILTGHRLLKVHPGPVVVMASSPPFSVAVAGAVLKSLHREKVIFAVDMRDAWAMHNALGGVRAWKRAIEGAVLRRADFVSTVSVGLADEFKAQYGVAVGVMYNVASHYFDAAPAARIDLCTVHPHIQAGRIKLVYTGSTPEGHYDTGAIVGAMLALRQHQPELADRVQLIFVGACDEVKSEALRLQVPEGDLVFVGHVAHALAKSIQASADALLFLAHFGPNNMGVVSTKLFEYLCLGQPVLPLCLHHGSDVDILLRRYAGSSINTHTAEEIAASLARLTTEGLAVLPRMADIQRARELLDVYRDHARRLLGKN